MRLATTLLALGVFALVGLGATGTAFAISSTAYDNEDFIVDVATANDLHITYYSDTRMTLLDHYSDTFSGFNATTPDGGYTWECVWSGEVVVLGQWVHVGVEFSQEVKNQLFKKDIYWTLDGEPLVSVPGKNGPGFKVVPPTGNVREVVWWVRNDGPNSIVIRGLQFRTQGTATALSDMTYGNLSGWDTERADFTLAAGDSVGITLVGYATPYYLMAQGTVVQSDVEVGHFVQQHEHIQPASLPGVTPWGLFVLSLALLTVGFLVIRRSRRVSA